MAKAVIFDYGVGNLLSLKTALEKAGLDASIGTSAKELATADAIALPGVGAFTPAAKKLNQSKIRSLTKFKAELHCLGFVWAYSFSSRKAKRDQAMAYHFSKAKTFGYQTLLRCPIWAGTHLNIVKKNELFDGITEGSYVYFVHSLYPVPVDKKIVCTQTEYGTTFTSAIASKNIYGTQFHPEKSGDLGLKILKNFAKVVVR